MNVEEVILVDENDQECGTMEKLKAHELGSRHRAFSIFVFNDNNEILLQKRAENKYHSGGLWTNTCCSHPRPNETLESATQRRLFEEMGFKTAIVPVFHISYFIQLDQGLIENEYDHVFAGNYSGEFFPNPIEVIETKWMNFDALVKDCRENPNHYTSWLQLILEQKAIHFQPFLTYENHTNRTV